MTQTVSGGRRQLSPLFRVFPAAVQRPEDFFDRDHPLEEILHTLRIGARQPVVVQGERGMGKTSLLLRLERALGKEHQDDWHWRTFYITPGRLDSWEQFSWELLDGLEFTLSDLDDPPILDDTFRHHRLTFNRLVQWVNRLMGAGLAQDPRLRVVILMDEIDKGSVHPDVLEKILASIHYLVEKTDLPLFFLMTIIARSLPEPAWGSPLPAKLIRLAPLDDASLDDMVTTLADMQGWDLPTDALVDWVHHLSGGHPYLAKLLLAAIQREQLARGDSSPLQWQPSTFLQRALQMEEARQLLEDVYRRFFSDEEKAVALELAARGEQGVPADEPAQWREPYQRALWRLQKRGYVWLAEHDIYRYRMAFWAEWLRAWSDWSLERAAHPIPGLHAPQLPPGICIVGPTQRVYVNGNEVEISGFPYRALFYLAQHAGQVVSKDELIRAIYPNEFHAATDQQIDVIISRVRKALGDTRPYRYLTTLRGRGYRLEQATILEKAPAIEA